MPRPFRSSWHQHFYTLLDRLYTLLDQLYALLVRLYTLLVRSTWYRQLYERLARSMWYRHLYERLARSTWYRQLYERLARSTWYRHLYERLVRSSRHRRFYALLGSLLLFAAACNLLRWGQEARTPASPAAAVTEPGVTAPAVPGSAVTESAMTGERVGTPPGEPLATPPELEPAPPTPDGAPQPEPVPLYPPYAGHAEDEPAPAVVLEGVENLGYYYGKLTLSELGKKGAITRGSLWGDSVIGGDGLTDTIRQRLQRRFGDAGHGFHALGKYSRWYAHRSIKYQERRSWDTCLIIFKCEKDRRYGYGGVSSESPGRALSVWQTVPEDIGSSWSRFELWYQKRPDGGGFEIRVDGQVQRVVDSRAPEVGDDFETVLMQDGEHQVEVAALGTGVARGYGVVLERDVPGAVFDELSLIGSFIQRLDYEEPEHIAGQVRRRDVDLLGFMFGGNDLSREHSDLKHTMLPYEEEYTRVLRKFRHGKPEASCVILAMTDHAIKKDEVIVSRPAVARLVAAQRKVALAEGCAFFDTYEAMGGAGAVARGRQLKPPLAAPDLRHPTVAGQRRIGTLFYEALMHGYANHRRAQVGKPLPALGASSS